MPRPGDPWALTVEAFEGPVICVAEAEEFSLRDWRRNALEGSNLVPQGGIGAFVAGRLGSGLDIRLDAPATRLRPPVTPPGVGKSSAPSQSKCIRSQVTTTPFSRSHMSACGLDV